jgi:Vam6/Vps39-like protein vacuolar protein sorting-associated protein 39
MAEETDDVEEKLEPTIRYLQKLGPEHLDLIFEGAKWIFATDWQRALVVRSPPLLRSRSRDFNMLERLRSLRPIWKRWRPYLDMRWLFI